MTAGPTKYRDGLIHAGTRLANYLRESDNAEYERKRVFGAVAIRNGELLTVRLEEEQDMAAVYSVGRNASSQWQVRGAGDARGTFRVIGTPLDAISLAPNIVLYGRRLMASVRLFSAPPVDDFAGTEWEQATFEVYRSRRGIEPEGYYALDSITPAFVLGASNFNLQFVPHGWRDVGGTPTFYQGALTTQMGSGGNPAHVFLRDDGTSQALGATLGYGSAIAWYATSTTLAPGVLHKVDRYLRGDGPYFAAPVCVVTRSDDAGATWTAVGSHPLFDTELAAINALDTSAAGLNRSNFNAAARWLRVITAPLSRAVSVVAAVVPYLDGTTLRARVKLGTVAAATGALTGSTVLLDGATPSNADAFLKDLVAVPEGVLVFTRPLTPDAAVWGRPARIQLTTDGATLTDAGEMPLPENRTGWCRALSTRRLVAPGYVDGAHRLFQSVDRGATWTRRAVIAADSRPPQSGENNQMLADFADVVYPRLGSAAVAAFPATPWLTDSRIDHA